MRRLAIRTALGTLLLITGVSALAPTPTYAHAFLVESDPAAGSRLSSSPARLSLRFTEPVAAATIALRTSTGETVPTAPLEHEEGGLVVVTTPEKTLADGVYIVSYQVLSADDGHATAGEYAFAVGGSGAVAAATQVEVGPSPFQVGARWLLLLGLLIGFGGLLSETFIWRPLAASAGASVPLLPIGRLVLSGVLGGLGSLGLQVVTSANLGQLDLVALSGTQSFRLLALGIAWALVGLLVVARPLLRPLALLLLGLALILVVLAGHADAGPPWVSGVDLLHVGAVAVWFGGLAQVVRVLWETRGQSVSAWRLTGVRHYANLALGAAAVAVLSGVLVAAAQLRNVSDLVTSLYGNLLLLKGVVVAGALLVAALARRRLPDDGDAGRARLRRLAGTEALFLLVAMAVTSALADTGSPSAVAAGQAVLGPPPLVPPVEREAGLAGWDAVFLAASRDQLQVRALAPSGDGDASARLTVEAHTPAGTSISLRPRDCGPGCWTMAYAWPSGATVLDLSVTSAQWGGGSLQTQVTWPPGPDRSQALAQVIAVMRAVPLVSVDERVTSGPGHSAESTMPMSGRTFMAGEPYAAGVASDVHEAGPSALSFFLPGSSLWFRLQLDPQGRIAAETIVDPGHLIERTLRYP